MGLWRDYVFLKYYDKVLLNSFKMFEYAFEIVWPRGKMYFLPKIKIKFGSFIFKTCFKILF